MSQGIEKSRNSCALQGAISTVMEIEGVVPIVHSTAGCTIQQMIGNKVSNYNGFDIPATNIIEKQVIFGGGSRLREQIKNTVKVIEGELYVVLTGCTPELVGDDVITMTKESQEQGESVIYFKAPGFKGKFHLGYEGVVNAIIDQLPTVKEVNTSKRANFVNIWGIIPNQDIHWQGDLEEIKRILEGIGLQVNTLFGLGQGIEAWQEVPAAALNIVFSKWGIRIAENLEKKYDTPFVNVQAIPTGAKDTINFIEKITDFIDIDRERLEKFIHIEKAREEYWLNSLLNLYVDYNFQRTFGIVGDESTVYSINSFLTKTLGLLSNVKIFTDPMQDENEILANNTYRTDTLNEIQEILREHQVELVLGSSLEKDICEELNIPWQVISFPELEKVILSKSYGGFKGGVRLLEDLSTILLSHERKLQQKNKVNLESLNFVELR